MTNTEQLNESLERLDRIRLAFKTGDVSAFGVDGLIAELLKVLRILVEERKGVPYSLDTPAGEVLIEQRVAPKRSTKEQDAKRTSREPVNGASPKG